MDKVKPITLVREEFIDQITDIINNAQLPAFVMLDVIRNVERRLSQIAEEQYRIDKARYEQQEEGSAG